jgi:hypothetical protein
MYKACWLHVLVTPADADKSAYKRPEICGLRFGIGFALSRVWVRKYCQNAIRP